MYLAKRYRRSELGSDFSALILALLLLGLLSAYCPHARNTKPQKLPVKQRLGLEMLGYRARFQALITVFRGTQNPTRLVMGLTCVGHGFLILIFVAVDPLRSRLRPSLGSKQRLRQYSTPPFDIASPPSSSIGFCSGLYRGLAFSLTARFARTMSLPTSLAFLSFLKPMNLDKSEISEADRDHHSAERAGA